MTAIITIVGLLVTLSAVAGWIKAVSLGGRVTELGKLNASLATDSLKARAYQLAAESRLTVERERVAELTEQLAREAAVRHNLVNALAKAGSPVGPELVELGLDVLYSDGGDQGAGALSSDGREPADMSSDIAAAPTATDSSGDATVRGKLR